MRTITKSLVMLAGVLAACVSISQGAAAVPERAIPFEYRGLLNKAELEKQLKESLQKGADGSKSDALRASALNLAGVSRFFLGDCRQAVDDFSSAIRLDSQAAYLANRGMAYRVLGDWSQARKDYEAALALKKDDPVILSNLGWLTIIEMQSEKDDKARQTRLQTAREYFDKAKALGGMESSMVRVNLAAALILDGDMDAARSELAGAKTQDAKKNSPWVYQCALLNQGELARCQGDWNAAAGYYKQANEAGSKQCPPSPTGTPGGAALNPWVLQRLGAASFVRGQYTEAADYLRQAQGEFGVTQIDGRYVRLLALLADARAKKAKTIELDVRKGTKPQRWIDALEMFMAGAITEDALKFAAVDEDPAAFRAKQCEMFFYSGQKKLMEDKADEAKGLFRRCVETGQVGRLECTMAMAEASK